MKKMIEKLFKSLAAITTAFCLVTSSQANENPELLIESTVQNLLETFTAQKDELADDKQKLFQLVDNIALPLFDFQRISKLVLAKNWKKANETQRDEFGEEFKKLLIGTYATALFQYTGNEKMVFKSTKISEKKGRKFATVESEVTLSSGPGIPVNYSMMLSKDGDWKIYNMNIAGLNMVTSYRKTYAAAISSQGIDGLIQSMKETNARNYGA